MSQDNAEPGYKILGVDDAVYGPIDMPTLVEWVQDERIVADTWIYLTESDAWKKASNLRELGQFFAISKPATGNLGFKPGSLRRVKVLADLSNDQLVEFAGFMEVHNAKQWDDVVRQNDDGNAMFLILDGEVRVRLMIDGREKILTTLGAGEFFGEVALFDQGPRSADVVANMDGTLLRISAASFKRLVADAPHLAAPFLFAVGKTLVSRIRADNKRYRDTVVFGRAPVGEN
jgi:CRP/FNR family transcriptional regulator, cyclic AMP receptor protein